MPGKNCHATGCWAGALAACRTILSRHETSGKRKNECFSIKWSLWRVAYCRDARPADGMRLVANIPFAKTSRARKLRERMKCVQMQLNVEMQVFRYRTYASNDIATVSSLSLRSALVCISFHFAPCTFSLLLYSCSASVHFDVWRFHFTFNARQRAPYHSKILYVFLWTCISASIFSKQLAHSKYSHRCKCTDLQGIHIPIEIAVRECADDTRHYSEYRTYWDCLWPLLIMQTLCHLVMSRYALTVSVV